MSATIIRTEYCIVSEKEKKDYMCIFKVLGMGKGGKIFWMFSLGSKIDVNSFMFQGKQDAVTAFWCCNEWAKNRTEEAKNNFNEALGVGSHCSYQTVS